MFRQSFILLVACILLVSGYPSGAPDSVCNTGGAPGHHAHPQDKDHNPNPFKVVASSASYAPGSVVQLKISGNEFFRGFFFQAFDKDTEAFIGEWETSSDSRLVVPCSGITHVNNDDKYNITLTWNYNGDQSGDLYFKGSIVQTYKVFWTQILSTVE